jgi:hypothetical protein
MLTFEGSDLIKRLFKRLQSNSAEALLSIQEFHKPFSATSAGSLKLKTIQMQHKTAAKRQTL